MNLIELGWNTFFAEAFEAFGARGLSAGRVVVQRRGLYQVVFATGDCAAEVSGRFRHETRAPSSFPAVGDWVAAQPIPGEARAIIQHVLPRRTKFSRAAPGSAGEEQVLAANVDDVFVVEALSGPLNTRRIERFLTVAWESGAQPTLLLTKSDLCRDVADAIAQATSAAPGVAVLALSNVTGEGLAAVKEQIGSARTAALIGPSGVGKSTLINELCGDDLQFVQPVRASDQKGRHSTTERELILLPDGGLIIDTPGLRELQLWDAMEGLEENFADIEAVACGCRFSDCQHASEPGCAVLHAVQTGALPVGRLESHRKLKRELALINRARENRPTEERRRVKNAPRSMNAHEKKRK